MDTERTNPASEDDPDSLDDGNVEQDIEDTRAGAEEEDGDVEALHGAGRPSEVQTAGEGQAAPY